MQSTNSTTELATSQAKYVSLFKLSHPFVSQSSSEHIADVICLAISLRVSYYCPDAFCMPQIQGEFLIHNYFLWPIICFHHIDLDFIE
jgi:hypothetical protein